MPKFDQSSPGGNPFAGYGQLPTLPLGTDQLAATLAENARLRSALERLEAENARLRFELGRRQDEVATG